MVDRAGCPDRCNRVDRLVYSEDCIAIRCEYRNGDVGNRALNGFGRLAVKILLDEWLHALQRATTEALCVMRDLLSM